MLTTPYDAAWGEPSVPIVAGGLIGKLFAGRYRAIQTLKDSGESVTLLGNDTQTGHRVVIKAAAARGIASGAQMRLEHEAGVLRQVQSPTMASLLHVGCEQDVLFLVMECVPGITLEQRLRRDALSVSETTIVGRSILTALGEAHRLGVLHRDIKPANVIVNETPPTVRATLIDFGFARSARLDASLRAKSVGTVRYMSPEQAGLFAREVDETADLYSLGVVLFECLAGRPPFAGEHVGDTLRSHLTVRPPELRSLGLAVPRALDELIQRLLRKDPSDRYQSAGAVLADLNAIAELLERGEQDPALVVGLHDQRCTLTEPAFVGREEQLTQLDDQVREVLSGRGGLLTLEAVSGGGKTRLLAEFAQQALRHGVWTIRSSGVDHVGQRPFQVLEGVVEEIIAAAYVEPKLASAIRTRLGDHLDAVCAALPRLAQALEWTPAKLRGPEAFGEARTLGALAALLDALGSAQRPAVVVLDDCQWADELAMKLLERWSLRPGPAETAPRHVALVVAYRSEEIDTDHALRRLRSDAHLVLPPFRRQDVRRLVESMAGQLPPQAVELVEQLSEGSPFMASAVLRGLVESEALVADAEGWRIEPLAMANLQSSRHAAALLARRIELLPEDTLELLAIGAVLGKQFELHVAAVLAAQTPSQVIGALDVARQRHLIWVTHAGTQYEFVHDRVRETLLERLTDRQSRDLHHRAALHLEKRDTPPNFELAYHFDAAGESRRALPYALAAAKQARAQHSLGIAEQQYRIAERGAADVGGLMRYQVEEGLADVLMLRGEYGETARRLEAARRLAHGAVDRAQIEGKLGELAFKRGDMKTAAAAIERALNLLGRRVPRRFATFMVWMCWEACVQVLHTVLPWLFVGRRRLDRAQEELIAIRLYSRLGHAYWFARGKIPTLWAHLRDMNLAERYPPTLELAQAYSEHAPAMSLIPLARRGIAYARKSLAIRKRFGDLWGQGQSLHYYGVVLYAASRFEECIARCREAVRLLERTGDHWEMNIARYQIAASLYRLGDLQGAVHEAQNIHRSGVELGDAQSSGISLDVWAMASGGRLDWRLIETELRRPREDAQATAQVLQAQGVQLLHENRFAEAVEVFRHACRVVRRAGVKNAWVAPILPWLATALRMHAASMQQHTPAGRDALLRQARTVVKQGLRIARRFQNDLPHVLREGGLLAAMEGRLRRARRLFDESAAVARRHGARYELAKTLAARAEVGAEAGWPGAELDLAAAQAERLSFELSDSRESQQRAPQHATVSLVDRFDNVLDCGRQIASGLSRETIFAAVQDAAIRLLRGDYCRVFEVAQHRGESPFDPDGVGDGGYSHSMVQQVLKTGRAQSFVDGAAVDENESVVLAGVRSALCAPILVRGQVTACFYVSHAQIAGLFGADELRLADFIATIAGAALENAAGFAELEQLNATLESRVAERTATAEQKARQLARSNAELEQFAYVASHDLQEPLRTVASYCQLLERRYGGQLDDKAREFIRFAVEGAARMKSLVGDLLAYSRVGTQGRPFEPVDFREILDRVRGNLAVALEESAAELTADELPVVEGDPSQLTQLLQNLIGNAAKFRADRPLRIHVGVERLGTQWRFSVQDNGIGMEREFFDRVFLIFQRLHGRDEYEGTGIGLAICKKTVERHGGHIWVQSELGQGSTFYFTLPTLQSCQPAREG